MGRVFKLDLQKFEDAIKHSGKDVSVFFGGVFDGLKNKISAEFPHQKILVLCAKNEQNEYKDLVTALTDSGVKPLVAVLNAQPISIERVSPLFTYPEDVRAVVCFNTELLDYAYYYAQVKGVKLYLAVTRLDCVNLLRTSIRIKNGNYLEEIKVSPSISVVFDQEKIRAINDGDKSAYESAISLALALVEYRLMRVIKNKRTYKEAYTLIKECVTETFDITSYSREDRRVALAYYTLLASVANYASYGEILKDTTFSACLESRERASVLDVSTKVLALAKLIFVDKKRVKNVPNYLERAEFLAENFGIDRAQAFSNFLVTSKLYKAHQKQISNFFSDCAIEIDGIIKSLITAKRIANNLTDGAKESTPSENAIKYLGDLSKNLNICAFLREAGVLEQI